MPKPIQLKKLLLLMLLFSSSTNVLSDQVIKSYIKNQWQDSRYINHGNVTVTDTKTTLMWKRCPEGLSGSSCTIGIATTHTYKAAIELTEGYSFAGYSDWRLPNIKELGSLVALDRRKPAINSTLFPNTPTGKFWSSSPDAYDTNDAWILNFINGGDHGDLRGNNYYVRLVRGGQ